LHIAKNIREKYNIETSLFELNGNLVLADFKNVRILAERLNKIRKGQNKVSPGELNAIGLLDEIYHFVLSIYEKEINPGVTERAYKYLEEEIGETVFNFFIQDFVRLFPPIPVYNGEMSVEEYLSTKTNNKSNSELALEELQMLYLENLNPAAWKLKELFDSNYFGDRNTYLLIVKSLQTFYSNEPKIGPENLDVISFFKQPFELYPNDLEKQLFFIKEKWKDFIEDKFNSRILTGRDIFKEEFKLEGIGGGKGPAIVPQYKPAESIPQLSLGKSGYDFVSDSIKGYEEPEQFTPDVHWMPNVVLLAKNTYVWLDQLSKKYNREIKTLDQIPDEELDLIASRHFNAIWLIGVWERSSASKKIKHILGNTDAVASAYSLYDYVIAQDLGGEEAYRNLDARCKQRGIRLASDMVPNHTGIYSDWTINHPDYFIQRNDPPFPNYKFTGKNLSEHPDIEIRIEDGYYSRTDAAVVFEWKNNKTGEVRYIYHGNDGTNMPWNDTAQLNMLKAEVREAVIQKIFEVARRFSIIRFDAAMTLAKKHFQRLWYPQPGTGGDIPSRSEYALTRKEFDEFFPKEFWREVVDRINEELPETLLLAEAFWLMEGYFVRTLGMHRVYNSAFMHMMMNEENDKYRDLITNTLEFDPDILKRYVNFMSNPDEETAIKQFGVDDKYFGVCVLMSTLPGLPMFAHGQIEGFTEKYGMEYKRAYYDEEPNEWLIDRHNKEIFPLLQKRYLFSDVDNFWFYDFIDEAGHINENVFAFTNSFNNEKVLVLYNNKYDRACGKLYHSTPKINKNNGSKTMTSKTLSEALGIRLDPNYYYIVKELTSKQEYLFSGDEFSDGLHLELDGFKYRVFWGFEEVYDKTGELRLLKERLQREAAPSIEKELESLRLQPLHNKFEKLFEEYFIKEFVRTFVLSKDAKTAPKDVLQLLTNRWKDLIDEIKIVTNNKSIENNDIRLIKFSYSLRLLSDILEEEKFEKKIKYSGIPKAVVISERNNYNENSLMLLLFHILEELQQNLKSPSVHTLLDELELNKSIDKILRHSGRGKRGIYFDYNLLNILLDVSTTMNKLTNTAVGTKEDFERIIPLAKKEFAQILDNKFVTAYISVNEYKNEIYYSKENYEELLNWLFTISIIKDLNKLLQSITDIKSWDVSIFSDQREMIVNNIKLRYLLISDLIELSNSCEYKYNKLKAKLID